jgi:regulator of replication initiation timing
MKIDKKELLNELQNFDGQVTDIAKKFGMTPRGLRKRIQENADLKEAQLEARERLVDIAQSQLGVAVRKGDAWAVKFTLETWGKSRGFTKQIQVDSNTENEIVTVFHYVDDGRNPYHPPGFDPPKLIDVQ